MGLNFGSHLKGTPNKKAHIMWAEGGGSYE